MLTYDLRVLDHAAVVAVQGLYDELDVLVLLLLSLLLLLVVVVVLL